MRTKRYGAKQISFSVGFREGGRFHKTHRLAYELYTTKSIYEAAMNLFGTTSLSGTVSFIAVSVSALSVANCQGNLFDDRVKENRLAEALDSINNTYGEYTMYQGIMHGMDAHGRDRVGYRKTVDVDYNEKDSLHYEIDTEIQT